MDYNDLLKFTLYIFEQDADIRLKWQQRLEYIMVDEFQDIDEPQYTLMQVLCGYHHNLFVVGDPDQTIYTWRGANIRYLLDFDQVFPGTRTILMMENYRSTPQILSVANSLIAKNTDRMEKSLLPTLPDGAPVRLHHARSAADEAAWMAAQMQALHDGGTPYRDMTVLYRAHYLTRTVEEVLQREKIPYTIYSGVQFFGRAEIKDALSYLRMIACQDDLSFLRIVNQPKRNIGERRRRLLQEQAAQEGCSAVHGPAPQCRHGALRGRVRHASSRSSMPFRPTAPAGPFEVLSAILHESGYEAMSARRAVRSGWTIFELNESVYEYETTCGEECTLEHYLAHVALFTNADAGDSSDRVKLMTVHTAKGLEFPHVFLCAMNEGLFPSKKIRTLPAMEEERRLAFVAMTRAEQGLYLSEAAGRNFDGTDRYPSRFLLDIAPGLLEQSGERDDMLLDNARSYIAISERTLRGSADAAAFRPGQRVRHSILGTGTMLELDEAKQAWLIRFDGLPTPRRISFRARLTPCPEQEGDTPS
ncbi:MAG: ATP-dependent helicase [Oscillospiraceae bacterium]